jgi:FdhD protein
MNQEFSNNKDIVLRKIKRITDQEYQTAEDSIAEEAPLEIRIVYFKNNHWPEHPLSITMRSPGKDELLAIGFLFTEGIIHKLNDLFKTEIFPPSDPDEGRVARIDVFLNENTNFNPGSTERNFYMASSCGICGKSSMDMVCHDFHFLLVSGQPCFNANQLFSLQEKISHLDTLFSKTGGAHAAFLLDKNLEIMDFQEDIGRHNALDKLIGHQLIKEQIPLNHHILLLSGRISFELVQKALRAGIGFIAAFGAASDGAIRLAELHGMTLVGFLKSDSMNIYCDQGRVSINIKDNR